LENSPELDSRLLALVDDPDLRVRYQLAFSLGEWKGPRIGTALARLALKDWSEEPMRTAVLSSSAHHLETVLGTVLAEAAQRDVPGNLVERFVRLSAEMGQDRVLASALEQISRPAASRYAGWQMAGLLGLLDGLSSRQLSLAAFENQCAPDLQKRVVGLEPLFDQARQVALDFSASEAERLQAVRLLGREVKGEAEDIGRLGELLSPRNSSALQQAALAGLQRASSIGAAEVLLKAWRAAGLGLRQQILNALFSRTAWTEVLMSALEEKKLTPSEVGTLQQQKLLNNSAAAVRDRAVKLFATINADRQKIVESYKIVADLKGDRAHGHILFTQNCSVCHRLQGEGHNIGPDLGTVVDKPAQELVVAILDPNQAVDPAYTGYTVVTKDDRELSGILAAETPNSITLRMAGGAEELISRGELKEFTSSGRSLMPEGFEAGLKPQDLADLISYVLNPQP
jgi:putative heme-binding domain-containing protein